MFPILKSLSNPDYSHQYFVDGQLTDGDAYLSSTWKNVLLGSTGAGPAAIFALDITAPDAMNATNVMWEKTPADTGLGDMGKVMGPVSVVLLTTGKWAAIFGNGYDSSSGKAMLYILDLSDGSLITKFDLGGTANGLTAPALVFNSSRQLVGAYAGDLLGKLWKFDLSDASSAKWTSSLLFTTS
ncbi:MAG: PilC/PilY family type IV pilus protein, partial [Glaciimonas sp.]|nr:PilC/PilY family type IV pilus protein [Glaciimonas sp.]